MPNPISPLAQDSVDAFNFALLIGTGIFLLVTGLVIYMIARFRARPGQEDPVQDFGNRRLEIGWTLGPVALLIIVLVITFGTFRAEEVETSKSAGAADPVFMTIIGHQWWWELRYAQSNVVTANEIHLPVGKRVLVEVRSADVVHDVWLPQLGPKMDANPNLTTYMWLQADQPGTYQGVCAEYCGTAHAWMLLRAVAQPQAAFDAWLGAQATAAQPTEATAARGAQEFAQHTCISCHAIAGTAAKAQVGPNLTHFGSRQILASGRLDNTPQNLAAWLTDPQALKPGNLMPNVRLTPDEVQALTAYLESLK